MAQPSPLLISGDWPSLSQLEDLLKTQAAASAGRMQFSELGRSVQDRPLWHLRLTDPAVPDDNKQAAIILAYEHGTEQSGTMSALRVIDYLLSSDGEATLARQVVHVVPVVNVDRWDSSDSLFNHNNANLWADYHHDGTAPAQPESRAVFELMEKIQPDLVLSLHGVSMDWEASGFHRNWESTHVAYTNAYARSYNRKVVDRINAAAEDAGYPMDLGEEDLERILPWLPGQEHHSLPTYNHYAGSVDLAYSRYHSLAMVMEIATADCGFIRVREALNIGNETWPYECYPGYPNRMITAACISLFTVTAGGVSVAERRQNRVNLWRHSQNFTTGMGPRHGTHFFTLVSRVEADAGPVMQWDSIPTIRALMEQWQADGLSTQKTVSWLAEAGLADQSTFLWTDGKAVSRFREYPDGAGFASIDYDPALRSADCPMAASLRLRLDRRAKVRRIMLNDFTLTDAQYRCWSDDRYQYLETDLEEDWLRAVWAVETEKLPGSRIGEG